MGKKENIILDKSYNFAVKIVNVYKSLCEEKKEYTLSKQLLRCGTSIGANVEEAEGAQSKKDFISKISIAYKEARETRFWIKLLSETDYLSERQKDSLLTDIDEILKILASILKTTKNQIL